MLWNLHLFLITEDCVYRFRIWLHCPYFLFTKWPISPKVKESHLKIIYKLYPVADFLRKIFKFGVEPSFFVLQWVWCNQILHWGSIPLHSILSFICSAMRPLLTSWISNCQVRGSNFRVTTQKSMQNWERRFPHIILISMFKHIKENRFFRFLLSKKKLKMGCFPYLFIFFTSKWLSGNGSFPNFSFLISKHIRWLQSTRTKHQASLEFLPPVII